MWLRRVCVQLHRQRPQLGPSHAAPRSSHRVASSLPLSSLSPKPLDSETGIEVSHDGGLLNIKWPKGSESRFHGVWLRHNCHCESCRAPAGQRKKNVLDHPKTATISKADLRADHVAVSWIEDSHHLSLVPLEFLQNHCYSKETLDKRDMESRPKTYTRDGIPQISLKDIQYSRHQLLKWLGYIGDYGVCLVTDIPTVPGQVAKLAEIIAPVQTTSYGRTFQVVNEPDPINIAYSMSGLNLHMDLLNYESPPGLQLLHCISFDQCVSGGGSHILDIFHVAEEFRQRYPKEFKDLARIPATFQRIHFERDNPVFMTFQRPHILLNHREEISAVFWTQQNEGPLSVAEEDVEPYYNAYRLFAAAIRESDMLKCIRLEPGEALVFNNRRVLHGRDQFTLNGGRRHLEGCYVNIDEFKSRYRHLSHELGEGGNVRRVGNQCWF